MIASIALLLSAHVGHALVPGPRVVIASAGEHHFLIETKADASVLFLRCAVPRDERVDVRDAARILAFERCHPLGPALPDTPEVETRLSLLVSESLRKRVADLTPVGTYEAVMTRPWLVLTGVMTTSALVVTRYLVKASGSEQTAAAAAAVALSGGSYLLGRALSRRSDHDHRRHAEAIAKLDREHPLAGEVDDVRVAGEDLVFDPFWYPGMILSVLNEPFGVYERTLADAVARVSAALPR